MLMNRTLIVSKVLAGQGPRVNFFHKIIIIILRLNYSRNYELVAVCSQAKAITQPQ